MIRHVWYLGQDGRVALGIIEPYDPGRRQLGGRDGHEDLGGADRVRPGAVGRVVDPAVVLQLEEPAVLARVPVVRAGPALLAAVLAAKHPPVAANLGDVGQVLERTQ